MYQVGEKILYGNTGVCQVKEIREVTDSKTKRSRLYYVVQPLYQSCTISIPVDNDKVYMRPILTREEADRLIDRIPQVQGEAYHSRAVRDLSEHYAAALRTHDCGDLVELTKSIYTKKQDLARKKKKFGAVDERFMKRAEELLFGELAAALEIDREEVQDYISNRLKT